MLKLRRSVRIFASATPVFVSTDIDGLVRLVRDDIGEDPFSGHIFCFFNRRRDRVKLLVWDRNGFWTLTKRLERGFFEPLCPGARRVVLSREQLVMLLSGVDTKSGRFRRDFAREVNITSRESGDRAERATR
ncbi:MAG: IS66 family insertion sequence element accessory protein TnpB [Planctomycetes bacterium]|nr:IS66 family insertion sequence element accessory protein TnpB [Planctomycetota bacterium]